MHIETERKFLVKDSSYKAAAIKSYHICQGYIAHDSGNSVRVRIRDKQGFLTIKGPSADGVSRQEWEREIPLEDARELFLLCKPGSIDKIRWIVPAISAIPAGDNSCSANNIADATHELSPAGTQTTANEPTGEDFCFAKKMADASQKSSPVGPVRYFEVDEFFGENEGLVMAEIELSQPDEPFDRPAWLGQEVTGDRRYYNAQLCQHPFKSWK